MTNPTTNFGWQMPTATDLVTDLPADFEVFGQAVDTDFVGLKGGTTGQVLAKASGTDLDFVWSADAAGMTNPMTTTADIIYSSSGSTPARLGIGSNADVLTVAGGVPTWAAPAGGGGADFTLLNSGGTTLSGSTTTVSGISGQNTLLVIISDGGISAANRNFRLRINTDTTTKYFYYGININNPTSYAIDFLAGATGNDTYYPLGATSSNSATTFASGTFIYGANTTNLKVIDTSGAGAIGGGNTTQSFITKGYYSGTATVSSISIYSDGTFNAGKVYVYGSAV
jgi:hypothetical protein